MILGPKIAKNCSNEIKLVPKTHKSNIRKVLKNCSNEIRNNEIHIRRGSPVPIGIAYSPYFLEP